MPLSPAVESTLERLEEVRQRWWMFSWLCHLLAVLFVSLGTLVLCILSDAWLQLSQPWLVLMLGSWAGMTLVLLVYTAYRRLRYQRSAEATARRVELSFPELGSHLINLLQLSNGSPAVPSGFQQAAIAEAVARLQEVRFEQAPTRQTRLDRWRWGLLTGQDLLESAIAMLMLGGMIVILNAVIPTWRSSVDRLFTPWRFVPQVGAIQILEVTPGNASVLVGSRVEIRATIAEPGKRVPQGTLFVQNTGASRETAMSLLQGATATEFTAVLPAVAESFQYRLEIGDSQSGRFQLEVCQRPTVSEVQVTYEYPSYLGLSPRIAVQSNGDLEAPQFTIARLQLRCQTPLARGYLQFPQHQVVGRLTPDHQELQCDVLLDSAGSYTMRLVSEQGHADPDPRVNSVSIVPDSAPTIRWIKPTQDAHVGVGGELPVVIQAADDHGLGEIRLEWQTGTSEKAQVIHRWGCPAGDQPLTLAHRLNFPETDFLPEQVIQVRAVAVDRRRLTLENSELLPQEAATPWLRITLQSAEQEAAEAMTRLEGWHARLLQILQTQLRARARAAECAGNAGASGNPAIGDLTTRQIQIQADTAELAKSLSQPDAGEEAERVLKGSLNKLANGPMLLAVRQAEELKQVGRSGEATPSIAGLIETQDSIIAVLRGLLDVSRRATAEALAEMKHRPGGDLPDDVEAKLAALSDKLKEFLKQQKRVIEATENLAKKSVDDFTEQDQQRLSQLAATEDEWSRFLAETHSDFSKLPEQDLSNPSMLREMVEVQTELKMAAGALTKKAADIAVPLEQLGAEMAEELTTNIEKWLPDTPDRERWSQEEPLTDEMKEAPLAELPGELEDLVGKLMEDEEDLFDEMEDASSSWADSIDKGAGWDAADGPISNMSAKGVTGNRLPNNSEIGGRSGEGRQGKSSGEFVGDTAVGKGGRKTPSRLAPDPFVKGQVKDVSKDPVGGATGGGKESGVGGEGLEGPVSPRPQRELERIANRQADLRNRAESIELKFQISQFHRTDLDKMIEMMRSVEADLKSGRYQSALRRREVLLDGLGILKGRVAGEMEVRRDLTSDLPAAIQKELLGSMSEASPMGWEELNRRYFARLAGSTSESGQGPPASHSAPAPLQTGATR